MERYLSKYIKYKLSVLKELQVRVTKFEKEHLKTLKNEIQIDNFCRTLILDESGRPQTPMRDDFVARECDENGTHRH